LIVVAPDPTSKRRTEDATNLSSPARPVKKLKCDGTADMVEIKTGVSAKLCTRKIAELNDKRLESLQYFGREGTQIIFEELILSKEELKKKHKGKYNISLIGNPGAGKSTLVWAVAHKIVNVQKEKVLWMSRRDSQRAWTVHLFEWDDTDQKAYIYKIENAPEDVKQLLDNILR
jgi:signal recognition particle GTPase